MELEVEVIKYYTSPIIHLVAAFSQLLKLCSLQAQHCWSET